jgi:cell division protein FtsL
MIVFMISGIIQFFLPSIKLPLIMLFLYIIGSMYLWNNSWVEEWILFTIVVATSFLAIALVKFYTKIYMMAEKRANEINE